MSSTSTSVLRLRHYLEYARPDKSHQEDTSDGNMKSSEQAFERQIQSPVRLLSYDELLVWQRDNPYILRGYRPETLSFTACFKSWLYLHNETFNIYSHLIPSVLFSFAQIWAVVELQGRYPTTVSFKDHVVVAWFLLAASATLLMSALYHTLMNHSMQMSSLYLRFDFAGILFLILGNFVSGIYVGFYCEPNLQKLYWGMVSGFLHHVFATI